MDVILKVTTEFTVAFFNLPSKVNSHQVQGELKVTVEEHLRACPWQGWSESVGSVALGVSGRSGRQGSVSETPAFGRRWGRKGSGRMRTCRT